MSEPPLPPPRHVNRISTTKSTTASSSTIAGEDVGKKTSWKDSIKSKGKAWGGVAYEKGWKWSDAIGGKVNDYAGKVSLRCDGVCIFADQVLSYSVG